MADVADEGSKWVQCDLCQQWRSLPGCTKEEYAKVQALKQWTCSMNRWDIERASCSFPEELEDVAPCVETLKHETVVNLPHEQQVLDHQKKPVCEERVSHMVTASHGNILVYSTEHSIVKRRENIIKDEDQHMASDGSGKSKKTEHDCDGNLEDDEGTGVDAVAVPLSRLRPRRPKTVLGTAESLMHRKVQRRVRRHTLVSVPRHSRRGVRGGRSRDASCSSDRPTAEESVPADRGAEGSDKGGSDGQWSPSLIACGKRCSDSDLAPQDTPTRLLGRAKRVKAVESSEKRIVTAPITEPPSTSIRWVQCDVCQKWRRLPGCTETDYERLTSAETPWVCFMNYWDPSRAQCDAPEEGTESVMVPSALTTQFDETVDLGLAAIARSIVAASLSMNPRRVLVLPQTPKEKEALLSEFSLRGFPWHNMPAVVLRRIYDILYAEENWRSGKGWTLHAPTDEKEFLSCRRLCRLLVVRHCLALVPLLLRSLQNFAQYCIENSKIIRKQSSAFASSLRRLVTITRTDELSDENLRDIVYILKAVTTTDILKTILESTFNTPEWLPAARVATETPATGHAAEPPLSIFIKDPPSFDLHPLATRVFLCGRVDVPQILVHEVVPGIASLQLPPVVKVQQQLPVMGYSAVSAVAGSVSSSSPASAWLRDTEVATKLATCVVGFAQATKGGGSFGRRQLRPLFHAIAGNAGPSEGLYLGHAARTPWPGVEELTDDENEASSLSDSSETSDDHSLRNQGSSKRQRLNILSEVHRSTSQEMFEMCWLQKLQHRRSQEHLLRCRLRKLMKQLVRTNEEPHAVRSTQHETSQLRCQSSPRDVSTFIHRWIRHHQGSLVVSNVSSLCSVEPRLTEEQLGPSPLDECDARHHSSQGVVRLRQPSADWTRSAATSDHLSPLIVNPISAGIRNFSTKPSRKGMSPLELTAGITLVNGPRYREVRGAIQGRTRAAQRQLAHSNGFSETLAVVERCLLNNAAVCRHESDDAACRHGVDTQVSRLPTGETQQRQQQQKQPVFYSTTFSSLIPSDGLADAAVLTSQLDTFSRVVGHSLWLLDALLFSDTVGHVSSS